MQKGFFISDRSGFRFKLSERTIEPGTRFVVAKSESDGIYNLVTDPLNRVRFYKDNETIRNARPPDNLDRNQSWSGVTTTWGEETTQWNFIQETTMPRAYFNAKKDEKKPATKKKKSAAKKMQGYKGLKKK